MASGLAKGIGYGATGASIGAGVGGPVGAAIGGGIGLIGGLFAGSDSEPDPYVAPSFADINLQRDNPELYAELQQLKQQEKLQTQLYQARIAGPTVLERAQESDAANATAANSQARGQLGTSVGNSAREASADRIRQMIQERAMQEGNAHLDNANRIQQQYLQGFTGGQNAIMANRVAEAKAAAGASADEAAASNQFYSGLANAGFSGIANGLNSYNLGQTADANPYPMQTPYGSPSVPMAPTGAPMAMPAAAAYSGPMGPYNTGPLVPPQTRPGYGVYAPGYGSYYGRYGQ